MIGKLGLFSKALKTIGSTRPSSCRKLYTDHIYPYPFKYFNEKVFPGVYCYRETHLPTPWFKQHNLCYIWGTRIFWTSFFYQLFWNPGAILGHVPDVDPSKWTDAELGIPPDEEGSYADWLENRLASEEK